MNCNYCNKSYYGQSRTAIKSRYGEHLAHILYDRSEITSVVHYVLSLVDNSSLEFVRYVIDRIF